MGLPMPTREFLLQQQVVARSKRDAALINLGRIEGAIQVLDQLATIAEAEEAAHEGQEAVAEAMEANDSQVDPPGEAPDAGKAEDPVSDEWPEAEGAHAPTTGEVERAVQRLMPRRYMPEGGDAELVTDAMRMVGAERGAVTGSGVPGDDGEAIDPLGR